MAPGEHAFSVEYYRAGDSETEEPVPLNVRLVGGHRYRFKFETVSDCGVFWVEDTAHGSVVAGKPPDRGTAMK